MPQKQIALFLNNLDEEYQISIYRAVRKEASRLNYQLLCVQSEPIFSEKGKSLSFYSAPWLQADGVLLLSSVIGQNLNKNDFDYISALFRDLPCVSIGEKFKNFSSILVHSTTTFSLLIEHLVVTHGYRKLLYIGGPQQHHDNIIRENTLLDLSQEYNKKGIPINLTIDHGEFHEYSGMVITQKYIQENPSDPFDAIIAANDNMAIGAIKALETSENPFWKKCAITGFDDIPLASLEYPPITTIHQPLETLGKEALDLLDILIRQSDTAAITPITRYVESTFVIRESCGCRGKGHSKRKVEQSEGTISHDIHSYTALPPNILRKKNARLNNGDFSAFLYLSIKSEQNMRNLSYLGQRLITVNTYEGMTHHLSDFLANLSVSLCYLFVFPEPVKIPGDTAFLIYKMVSGQEEYCTDTRSLVHIQTILAGEETTVQCIYPLKTGDKYVGILVYNSFDYTQPHMRSCATFLSNNLQRLYELELEKRRNQILEEQVQQRTQELVKAYKELQEESQRREAVEAEVLRISELERLRFSLDLHDDICQRLAGLSMYCKSLLAKTPNLREVIQMIDETLMLTRRYAHDAFPVELENLGLEKALENLSANIERQTSCVCTFSWESSNSSVTFSKAQEINIYRIVQEAVSNSIKHGRATKLNIKAKVEDSRRFLITIIDNGKGNELLNQFPANISAGGVGLRSMQYRTHQLHGTLSIHSSIEKGTTVSIHIPLEMDKRGTS